MNVRSLVTAFSPGVSSVRPIMSRHGVDPPVTRMWSGVTPSFSAIFLANSGAPFSG
jgi:hypothetical protein